MSSVPLFALVGAGLFCIGLYALIVYAHLLRKILAINVMGSGVFLVLATLADRTVNAAPDPVPHAMIITGIVVAVATTAFALVLMLKVAEKTGRAELPDERTG
ncbi:MAG: sodium:proton antiporter [Gammaproteobacteria bacterium]|nr:sodium:proton antiporter [Gammaproteobacteria bacterium]MDH5303210.1 sodium:proton antiporter [Gammaproteobacteria bacterium]MDH5322257.1 sodium:proton antiporter [Gammaproteobacteria bacterium]